MQLREQHLYYRDKLLPISRIIVHPEYYAIQAGFDIALLELEDPVNISCQVRPVTLPPASETFPPGTPCWVTGWGDVDNGGKHQGELEGLGEQGPVTPMTQLWGSIWGTRSSWADNQHLDVACSCLTPESLPPPFPLKQVKVPIVENSICDSKYHTGLYTEDNVRIVRDDMMCAGNMQKDSCQVGLCPPQSPTSPGLRNHH